MKNTTIKTLLILLTLTLTACSSTDDDVVEEKPAASLFTDAKKALDDGSYQRAITILSTIDARFPYGPISHQVQLDLIYAYYKSGDTDQGIALTDRFLKLNPDHPNVDYVYYMRGLINLSMEANLFQDVFGIDRSDRDPQPAKNAFNDFKTILETYPESKYAADARQRMIAIKSRLAEYELAVARYYIKREAWASAANRGRYILKYFPSNPEMEEALEIMIQSYKNLGLTDLEKNARQVLAANFPNNSLLK